MSNLITSLPVAYDYRGKHTNYNSRNGWKVDRVVVHHFAGHLDPDTLLKVFKNRTGSCTYAIFRSGKIGYYTDEEFRPWTTSSREIDQRAITIEVENEQLGPEWTISTPAMVTLIELLADICKRYPLIGRLRYDGTKNGSNLHMHEWYANTNCPGPYLKKNWMFIIDSVNKKLGNKNGVFKEGSSYFLYKNGEKVTTPGEHFMRDEEAPDDRKGYWVFVENDELHSVAVSKFCYIPKHDKWCFYDQLGHMVYGFAFIKSADPEDDSFGLYYFDTKTGAAAKGKHTITAELDFDELTSRVVSIPFYTARS